MGRLHLVNASSYCVMASSCATRASRNGARSAGARRASITVRRAEFMVSRMTMRFRRAGDVCLWTPGDAVDVVVMPPGGREGPGRFVELMEGEGSMSGDWGR